MFVNVALFVILPIVLNGDRVRFTLEDVHAPANVTTFLCSKFKIQISSGVLPKHTKSYYRSSDAEID